jgi:hypothetical protein
MLARGVSVAARCRGAIGTSGPRTVSAARTFCTEGGQLPRPPVPKSLEELKTDCECTVHCHYSTPCGPTLIIAWTSWAACTHPLVMGHAHSICVPFICHRICLAVPWSSSQQKRSTPLADAQLTCCSFCAGDCILILCTRVCVCGRLIVCTFARVRVCVLVIQSATISRFP